VFTNRLRLHVTLTHRVSEHSSLSKKKALPLSAISTVVLERGEEKDTGKDDINDRNCGFTGFFSI
jgi:hypothetical protein